MAHVTYMYVSASMPQEQDHLYKGEVEWTSVPFPEDPEWEDDISYVEQYKLYRSEYFKGMPVVPALMTYCEVKPSDESGQKHSVRMYYRSMVLKLLKWIIARDQDGLSPLNGDETKASESYGPVKASASFKTTSGASWEKTVKVTSKRVMTVEQGCSYQPTRIYAKLLCDVVHVKEGDFLVNGLGRELITTNARYEPVAPKHYASHTGFVKSITEFRPLNDAFGKNLST
ncbi:hypothetical protein BGZ70_004010 [Mortierella alpina]|uniref:Uncharacterized protein n=1 Tax=Mortierella alpina TaxID=64518 RepID=A0A9P6IUK6_MORAP|nr:hypothetical protein BGZ70_004010 [Mortierella alpina]